jgi:anti-sigma regulatory factor (Ser/Thr protein kinase)
MATQQERSFAAEPAAVPAVRHWVTALAEQASFSDVASDLALAVTEATSNVVRHSGSESITVVWRTEDSHAVIELSDEGTYGEQAFSQGEGGMGLPVMTAVMDEITIRPGRDHRRGTRVRLVKRKP